MKRCNKCGKNYGKGYYMHNKACKGNKDSSPSDIPRAIELDAIGMLNQDLQYIQAKIDNIVGMLETHDSLEQRLIELKREKYVIEVAIEQLKKIHTDKGFSG